MLKEASRLYAASWVRDIGPDLHPNDYKKDYDSEEKHNGVNGATKEKEPSTLEDLGEKPLPHLLESIMWNFGSLPLTKLLENGLNNVSA